MSVLNDEDLQNLSKTGQLASEVDSTDIGKRSSKIQPASLDLTIGEIYVPGTKPDDLGGINKPYTTSLALDQGHTAVIVTREVLNLSDHVAAIGFPPSSVSLNGLLMTNPGHIDPGYKGRMKFTVINMGRKPYELRVGSRIVTLVFLRLNQPARIPFDQLEGGSDVKGPSGHRSFDEEVLDKLSADFMDIDTRAQSKANEAIKNSGLISAAIVAAATIIATIWSPWSGPIQDVQQRISRLEGQLGSMQGEINLESIEQRVSAIENELQTERQ